jgi:hypothetical protein
VLLTTSSPVRWGSSCRPRCWRGCPLRCSATGSPASQLTGALVVASRDRGATPRYWHRAGVGSSGQRSTDDPTTR